MNLRGPLLPLALSLNVLGVLLATLDAQRAQSFMGSSEDPAIKYSTAPLSNVVDDVNRKLQEGSVQLTFEGRGGFLRSALDALQIPVDSQLLVFSRDSLQGKLINEQNPRAIYFNDRVALGWVRDFKSGGRRYAVRHTQHLFSHWHDACAELGLRIQHVREPMLDPADIPPAARFDRTALEVPVALVLDLRRERRRATRNVPHAA